MLSAVWVSSYLSIARKVGVMTVGVMTCDNCRQAQYTKMGIHSNVKSSVLVMVQCFKCGYGTVVKENSKRINGGGYE